MSSQYGRIEFWEKRYALQNQKVLKQFEWYQSYEQLKDVITQFITKDCHILNIGCGNSKMSEAMFKSGYFKITNVDWSPTVIAQMQDKYKDYGTHFKYLTMDARELTYEDQFDCIIDKGCLDSVLCGEYSNVHIFRLLDSVYNALNKNGVYICISYGQPIYRTNHLSHKQYQWTINTFKVYKYNVQTDQPNNDTNPENFDYIYVCRKKPLLNQSLGDRLAMM